MRCNRSRLAVALSLLLTAQSAQAGPMWTGRIEKRNPGAFLDVRMENSQAPTAAHDGYGSGSGDQTTPRPVFETLNSTPEPNPLLSENQGDDKKKSPYSDLPEPIEVIPVQPTSDAPEPTSDAQESTQEPGSKPTFTQNPSAPVLTTSIVPKDPTTVVEKPTSAGQSDYKPPKDTSVVSETGPVTKEVPTSGNEAPTSQPVNDATTVVPEVPTTEAAQKPENTETQSLSSTLDLGTLRPSDGGKTQPSAVEETTAPETPSAPATTAPGNEQPTSAVEEETTTFAYQPTPTGYLTTKAPSDTAFPVNPKHPTQVYPKPPTTSEGPLKETSAPEAESPAGTTQIVSVVQPGEPQSQTTSDAQSQPAPTSDAAQPETQAPVSEPAQPSNPAPTSEAQKSYVPVETPGGQQPDTPAATTAPAQPQNPVPTSQPAQSQPGYPVSTAPSQPQNPAPTSEPAQAQPETPVTSQVQQPEAPTVTSAVQQPAPVPSNGQPQYPVPDSNTQPAVPAAPPTSTVPVSDPSSPETTSAPKVVPPGTSANGVPTINPGVPTGTSAIPASAYASNVVDARTYNEEFAKLTPESSCMKGQAACINGQTGVCDDTGKFQLTPCNTKGEKCFALPLYNFEGGIKIVCEDPATAAKILGGTPSSGEDNSVPGNGNGNGNGGKEQPATTSAAEKPAVPVVTVTTIVTVDDGATPEPTGEPVKDQPSQPAQQPSQPQPVPEQPTKPAPEQTSQSAPDEPSQSQPLPEKSTQPAPEQPSQPAQTQPAEAQPSQPSEEKPSQTNPAGPSNPQPTKAYEDLPPTSAPVAEQSTTSVPLPGGTTLTKSIKKPDEAKPTGSPDDDNNKGKDGNDKGKDGHDDDDDNDKPTSVVLIPIPDKPTDAPSPAATEAKVDNQGSKDDKKPAAGTRTGDDAHATTIVVDGTPTVSVYFTVTVTEKDQATVTVTEKEKETVTLVISA
ncbi:uncharacterized protein FMAN_05965 [Fusarium mangiferae]|uniref:Uncharacterized protein n=1 Tax=Fusarium mangiferae TaxID=192010 RepID=A0A1L7SU61_FUSMA|nr:uncharacterized protein FMAN_05965 [Fusarium mangiferae]CVK86766.1 uncharacterized protein FMAN_05965 [Fusarium mangiferae]